MITVVALLQAATPWLEQDGWLQRVYRFVDTPLPFSPLPEYLILLFVLWLIARRAERKQTFDTQAQDVLDRKYEEGELSEKAYRKFRQEMTVRPKR